MSIFFGIFIAVALLALVVALPIALGVYVYGDSTARGMKAWLWTIVVLFAPGFLGLVLYLALRSDHPARRCPSCGCGVHSDFSVCPSCGFSLKNRCPVCSMPLEADWNICPGCATPVPEEMRAASTKKDKSMKVLLALLICILLGAVLLFTAGVAAYTVSGTGGSITYERDLTKTDVICESLDIAKWFDDCDNQGEGVYVLKETNRIDGDAITGFLIYSNMADYTIRQIPDCGSYLRSAHLDIKLENGDEGYTIAYFCMSTARAAKLDITVDGKAYAYAETEVYGLHIDDSYYITGEKDSSFDLDITIDKDLTDCYSLSATLYAEDSALSTQSIQGADGSPIEGSHSFIFEAAPNATSCSVTAYGKDGQVLTTATVTLTAETADQDLYLTKSEQGAISFTR